MLMHERCEIKSWLRFLGVICRQYLLRRLTILGHAIDERLLVGEHLRHLHISEQVLIDLSRRRRMLLPKAVDRKRKKKNEHAALHLSALRPAR
jgi:hypothetical protein